MKNLAIVVLLGSLTGCSTGHVRSEHHSWAPVADSIMGADSSQCGKVDPNQEGKRWGDAPQHKGPATLSEQWGTKGLCGLPEDSAWRKCEGAQTSGAVPIRCSFIGLESGTGLMLDALLLPFHLLGHALMLPFRWSPVDHAGTALAMGVTTVGNTMESAITLGQGNVAKVKKGAQMAQDGAGTVVLIKDARRVRRGH